MLEDGSFYYQPCYYCKNVVKTIISLQAILAASDVLMRWTQTGHKDGSPGAIQFDSDSGLFSITMMLENRDGLYYCPTDIFTVNCDPVRCNIPSIYQAVVDMPPMCVCSGPLVMRGVTVKHALTSTSSPPNDIPSIPWSPVVLPLWTPWGAC
jgi:hypothetical protein